MEILTAEFNASICELNDLFERKTLDLSELNKIVDKLNSIDCDLVSTDLEKSVKAVQNCCLFIPPHNSLFVAKCANFILNVICKLKLTIERVDRSLLVKWVCNCLDHCADIAYVDLLQLINAILLEHHSSFTKFDVQFFTILRKKLELNASVSNPHDIKILRINCLKNVTCILHEESHTHLARECLDILYDQETGDLILHSQVWFAVLEALNTLSSRSSKWLETLLNEVIGVIVYGIELGLNGKVPCNLKLVHPAVVTIPQLLNGAQVPKINLKVKKKQRSKVKQVTWSEKQVVRVEIEDDLKEHFNTNWVTSDSDVSDNESNHLAALVKAQAKTRHSAFNLLIQIIKVLGCKVLYEYYNILLGKLVHCVKNEKLSKPKIASLAAINALLLGAKQFLAQAQHSDGGAFTSFSEMLSELVSGLHSTLSGILNTVPHITVVIPLLHTTSSLISVAPYHRLRLRLLSDLFKSIYLYINHKDPTVSVGVLQCLSEIVIKNPKTNEQKEIILLGINDGTYSGGVWILSHCFYILKEHASSDVRVACWQIFGGLCQCHFEVISPSLPTLETYIFQDLNLSTKAMIYAAKTLEHLLSKLLLSDEFSTYSKELWMKLIDGPFVSLLENSRTVAAVACDCLSNIGPQVFNSLNEETQILIITLVYGCCYSDMVVVRGSAINTLGVFLLFPHLTHEQFVHDTKDILMKSLGDESDYVRAKAAWAFGNLVDLLVENQDKEFVHEISIFKLIDAALLVSNDHNRVKANILRAVGNLLFLVPEDQINCIKSKELIEKAVNFCLISSNTGTLMKMRWNACYAVGTLLQNDVLYRFSNKWLGEIINCLCNLLVKCNNFKVRANACGAICSVKKREYFGIYYIHVWSALLDGLDNAANLSDFKEFKHQDLLIQQLCCAICHLASLLEFGDIAELSNIILHRMETVKIKMTHFQNSAPPEKSGNLLSALNNVNLLLKQKLQPNEREFLINFQDIFIIV